MSDRLSVNKIKQIIKEEKKKLESEGLISDDTVKDVWSGGDNLVHKIDYMKVLGIKEAKHRKKAEVYKALREKLKRSIKGRR